MIQKCKICIRSLNNAFLVTYNCFRVGYYSGIEQERKTMALPISKNPNELVKLDYDKLQRYFERHARFVPDAPTTEYAIQFGSRAIFSDDTAKLREEFFKAVRKYKPPILPHIWNWDKGTCRCSRCNKECLKRADGQPDERTYKAGCPVRMRKAA